MPRQFKGVVNVDIRDSVPDWEPFLQPKAPAGAPNVLMIVWDDVGYGAMDVFGGPIETPTMRRIADRGLRYSNFHTTALCSPTRSSLLTGRNATSNNMACITEGSAGFPGFSARIPFENGTIAEVLGERGWNTYAIGKWHLTPADEVDLSSWRSRWPLGRGFERFYGFLGGETNQWYPDLVYDNHTVPPPAGPEDGYHLSKDLTDKAIEFIHDSKAVAPEKPWYMYFCPGCAHAPHHVFKEWSDRYAGRFDEGYEAIRATILENQKRLGLLPDDTELSPINPHGEPDVTGPDGQPWPQLDFVRPWESLSDAERRLFARMAEVYAGFVSYTDDEIARLLDYLEESGQLDNTIVMVVSDNGASGEGGPNGSVNENKFFNNVPDSVEDEPRRLDELGTPELLQPLQHRLGVGLRHAVPVLEAVRRLRGRRLGHPAGLVAGADRGARRGARPVRPRGRPRPDDLRAARRRAAGRAPGLHAEPDRGRERRGVVRGPGRARTRDAVLLDARDALALPPGLAGQHPASADLRLGQVPSRRVGAVQPRRGPLPDAQPRRRAPREARGAEGVVVVLRRASTRACRSTTGPRSRSSRTCGRSRASRATATSTTRERPRCRSRSRSTSGDARSRSPRRWTSRRRRPQGVLFSQGARAGGHALYVKDGRLHYTYNWLGEKEQTVSSDAELPTGSHVFTAEFQKTGDDPQTLSATGTLTLYIDTDAVGSGELMTQPGMFGLSGSGAAVGRGNGSSVSAGYEGTFPFAGGTIQRVVIDVSGDHYVDHEKEVLAYLARD